MKKLTKRQKEILNLLTYGMTNDEIAQELTITTHTVKKHLEQVFEILEVSSRVQATVAAIKLGYATTDSYKIPE